MTFLIITNDGDAHAQMRHDRDLLRVFYRHRAFHLTIIMPLNSRASFLFHPSMLLDSAFLPRAADRCVTVPLTLHPHLHPLTWVQ